MEFEHEHHQQTHEQVRLFLQELFDDPYEDDDGHIYVGYGTTVLEIFVEPYGPEDTTVQVTSYCVQGVEPEADLLTGLLELNHELPVGAFSLLGRDIFYSYSIFGRSLDRKTLLGAIAVVANVSDEYDNRIVQKFGGQTALDRIRDTGGRKRRSSTGDVEAN